MAKIDKLTVNYYATDRPQRITLPKGSEILSVAWRNDNFELYYKYDANSSGSDVYDLRVVVTGGGDHNLNGYTYLGPILASGGVFHVFYR